MRDARRIHERLEVRLDRPQIIWLTLGVVVLLAVSFALGTIAGRRAERLARTDADSSAGDPIARADDTTDAHEQLTFYRELEEPPEPTTTAIRPSTPKPAAAPEPPTRRKRPTAPKKKPDRSPREETKPERKGDVRAKLNEGPATLGQYTVQVSAFQSMDEAQAFAASLQRKGFSPFITEAAIPKKGTWYRVRMGAFDNELEATLAKQMLARKDIPAWVLKTD